MTRYQIPFYVEMNSGTGLGILIDPIVIVAFAKPKSRQIGCKVQFKILIYEEKFFENLTTCSYLNIYSTMREK